jgi:hypothetical protein
MSRFIATNFKTRSGFLRNQTVSLPLWDFFHLPGTEQQRQLRWWHNIQQPVTPLPFMGSNSRLHYNSRCFPTRGTFLRRMLKNTLSRWQHSQLTYFYVPITQQNMHLVLFNCVFIHKHYSGNKRATANNLYCKRAATGSSFSQQAGRPDWGYTRFSSLTLVPRL